MQSWDYSCSLDLNECCSDFCTEQKGLTSTQSLFTKLVIPSIHLCLCVRSGLDQYQPRGPDLRRMLFGPPQLRPSHLHSQAPEAQRMASRTTAGKADKRRARESWNERKLSTWRGSEYYSWVKKSLKSDLFTSVFLKKKLAVFSVNVLCQPFFKYIFYT